MLALHRAALDLNPVVSNAHARRSELLVFSDDSAAATALSISEEPSIRVQRALQTLFYNLIMSSGGKWGSSFLKVDSEGRVSAWNSLCDILLRKRA